MRKSRVRSNAFREISARGDGAVLIRADLETLGTHASELDRLRGEAVVEAENLKLELASQHELVASLETELRSKQATADLLERNVDRITDLGVSLAALDEQMNGGAAADGGDGLDIERIAAPCRVRRNARRRQGCAWSHQQRSRRRAALVVAGRDDDAMGASSNRRANQYRSGPKRGHDPARTSTIRAKKQMTLGAPVAKRHRIAEPFVSRVPPGSAHGGARSSRTPAERTDCASTPSACGAGARDGDVVSWRSN